MRSIERLLTRMQGGLVIAARVVLCVVLGRAGATVVRIPEANLRAMFLEALERDMRNDIEGTVGLLEQIVAQDPDFSMEDFDTSKGKGMIAHASMELGFCYHRQKRWADALPLLERGAAWVGPRLAARFPPPMIMDSALPGFIAGCRRHFAEIGQLTEPPAVVVNRQYNGHADFDASEGATSVPLAPFSQDFHAVLAWDEATQSATAALGEKSITFTLGRAVASVQSPVASPTTNSQQLTTQEVALRVVPYLDEGGRMMVPLRPLVEALGGTVKWEPEAQIVYVTMPTAASSQPPEGEPEAADEEAG